MHFVTAGGPVRTAQAGLSAAMTCGLWAAGIWLLAASAAGAEVSKADIIAGRWEVSLVDTNRQCELLLRAGSDAASQAVGMPAGCRRAIPVLADIGTWALVDAGRIEFVDRAGKPVLEFAPAAHGEFVAKGPEGENYRLVSANGGRQNDSFTPVQMTTGGFRPVAQANENGAAIEVAAAKGSAPALAAAGSFKVRATDVAGRYSILRAAGKDSGCMLTLDDKSRGPRGSFKAILAPGCNDQGILIFDPVGWQIEKGRLALVARKGHQTHLDQQADGLWSKDPKEGAPLELKKK